MNDSTAEVVMGSMDTQQSVPQVNLTADEVFQRGNDIQDLMNMAALRETAHPQFDGMGYSLYNQTNEMADMSYLAPKKNKMDSRIVTGVTHEKDTTILSLLTNFNFEVKVRAFDENNEELVEIGQMLTSLVRKSRELEDYDEKRSLYYRNLLVQGTTFIRERYVESYRPKKVIVSQEDSDRLDLIKWNNSGLEKVYDGCVSEFVDGKKVFLKDIRQWDIKKQPVVHTVEYIPRGEAQSIFGQMGRWKNVPKKITPTAQATYLTLASIYSDWTFSVIDDDKVEVWEVFDQYNNRYQLYLNGVPMLKADFPLTAISPSGQIPLSKGDLDRMNLFAYSKSIPAKTKIPQAVWDEVLRVQLIKFKQGAFVPRANLTDRVVSELIYMPGRITPDLDPKDLPPLIENPGLTPSDFSFFSLMKEMVDTVSVSSTMEGIQQQSGMTATEYMDLQKKQLLKLGASIDAIVNWEKQMAHLRTVNLIANWTNEVDKTIDETRSKIKSIYRTISVDETFDDGKKGTHMIKFLGENNKIDRDTYQEELDYKKKTGREMRISYVDAELLKNLKCNFYYDIVPVDKNNDKLAQMMFINNIQQAMALFGPQSLNVDFLKKRFAQVMGEDPDKFFADQGVMPQIPGVDPNQQGGFKPPKTGIEMPQPTVTNVMQT